MTQAERYIQKHGKQGALRIVKYARGCAKMQKAPAHVIEDITILINEIEEQK